MQLGIGQPLSLAYSGKSKLFQSFTTLHRTSDYRQLKLPSRGLVAVTKTKKKDEVQMDFIFFHGSRL